MNANVIPCTDTHEEATPLGVASLDTKGGALVGEDVGNPYIPGISED
ncbi:benenodin family lasso peptide [Luteimonas granuli]|uniref:Benenodin family lasso peptide n=1 Tax=Luteimonas granuli TaxID=1176533 RepID=A0A518N6K4_9GAMM|nr:benenodin family lasso peptide [Luteimonas granuli]QDW67551.1 benenodin family lasso peptide [Luteimonas granuli]